MQIVERDADSFECFEVLDAHCRNHLFVLGGVKQSRIKINNCAAHNIAVLDALVYMHSRVISPQTVYSLFPQVLVFPLLDLDFPFHLFHRLLQCLLGHLERQVVDGLRPVVGNYFFLPECGKLFLVCL